MNRKLKNLMYGIPIALASLLPMKEAKGQQLVWPSGVINPFIHPDNTEAALTYNSLNSGTRAERDTLADAIIKASRVHTIPLNDDPVFNCNNWRNMQIMNSYDWGDGIYEAYTDNLVYNGYKGFVLSEIYANGGTFADQGKEGLRLMSLTFTIPELNAAHAMVTLLTGNNALNGKDWNDTEPRDGITNVQPGELNIPLNTDRFIISLPYIFKNSMHEKNFSYFPILEFKIVNGEKILTYNVNDDPFYNTRMRLITQRESDPPVINIKQGTAPDSLVAKINDANLKSVWYTINGGEKIPLMTEVLEPVTEKNIAIKMNLPIGTNNIVLGADDYFRLVSQQNLERQIAENTPPIITISSPENGKVYDKDLQLIYSIADTDFASAWYAINNGTKTPINQSGTIPLTLIDGTYKIVVGATDRKPQTAKDSVQFQVRLTDIDPTGKDPTRPITYPNPTDGRLTILYPKENAIIEIYNITGKKLEEMIDTDMDGRTEADIGKYPAGLYIYSVSINNSRSICIVVKEK